MHDVLLVLGHSADPDDPVFRARMDTAVRLYDQGLAPQIIVSGCCSMKLDRRPGRTEAAVMHDYAVDHGVPSSVILLEEESVDTLGNFYFSKTRYLEPCSWYHLGVVTTPWHAFRSEWLAAQILGPDFTVATYATPQPDGWSEARIRHSELRNRTILAETQAQLAGVPAGDHAAVVPLLGRLPPA